ncbi:MAG: HDOD domain-containing protein [Clostridia bacterium]|nr:HDOD domain-containing protein [Clostridia bacterium]
MGKISLDEIVAKVDDIPGFSDVILRVMRLTEDPDSTAEDIQNVLVQDQGLTVKVLRLANSAHYGFARRIDTISQATILLGFQAIRSIVLAASCSPMLKKEMEGYGLAPGELWRHSQAVAITAKEVARASRKGHPEQAYTAGLLHDIGKIILNHYMKNNYKFVLLKMEQDQSSFLEAEEAVLGFNHSQLGQRIGDKWSLPPDLVEAIANHHQPKEENNDLTAIIHVADALVMMMGIGLGVDGLAYELSPLALERLQLTEKQLEKIMDKAVDLFSDQESFLL